MKSSASAAAYNGTAETGPVTSQSQASHGGACLQSQYSGLRADRSLSSRPFW